MPLLWHAAYDRYQHGIAVGTGAPASAHRRPINISSGYRCPDHNRAVGGVWNSQHVAGTAADIYVDGMGVRELADICKQIFDGVGTYVDGGFVHVDMREGGSVPGYFTWEG